MTEARSILFEQRENGNTVLIGRWPDKALVDPIILSEISPDARTPQVGDDFTLEVANGRARYRFVESDGRDMICIKIK